MAVQTIASEKYEVGQTAGTTLTATDLANAKELSEVQGTITSATLDENNKINTMTYAGTKYTISFANGKWDESTITKTTTTAP
ncbi:hypothetical protein GCM10008910_25050 [Faecalicatena orotica]